MILVFALLLAIPKVVKRVPAPLLALVLAVGFGERADEEVDERDAHDDRLLERHDEPADGLVGAGGQAPVAGLAVVEVIERVGRERDRGWPRLRADAL